MKRGSFKRILFKNTVALALPMLVLLAVLFALLLIYPVGSRFKDNQLDDSESLEVQLKRLYDTNKLNVIYEAKNLHYTGYDYKVDGKIKGAYYYNIDDNGINFFLIETTEPEGYIEYILYKGQIQKDTITVDHILNNYADNSDLDMSYLIGYINPYIISEVHYPRVYIVLVYLLVFFPIIVAMIIIIYCIIIWLYPGIHPQAKQLSEYGDVNLIIKDIEKELSKELVFNKNNVYITKNYLVVSYLTRVDVVKLDLVKYMSKNVIEGSRGVYRGRDIIRLTFSNPEKLFYEIDFINEEFADKIAQIILAE